MTMSLQRGDVCFYTVTSKCGLPKIDLLDSPANVVVEYIMFENGTVAVGDEYTHGSRGGAPASKMPWRSEPFVYEGNRKVY